MSVVLDPIMLAQLTSDLSRILKMNMARFDNDTSACYDQVIVLGMLAARRCGMPETAISTHSSVLKFMRYAVKTMHGVSIQQYSGTEDEALFGTGQARQWHLPKNTNSIITCCRDVLGI